MFGLGRSAGFASYPRHDEVIVVYRSALLLACPSRAFSDAC